MFLLGSFFIFVGVRWDHVGDQPVDSVGDAVILVGRHGGILFVPSERERSPMSRILQSAQWSRQFIGIMASYSCRCGTPSGNRVGCCSDAPGRRACSEGGNVAGVVDRRGALLQGSRYRYTDNTSFQHNIKYLYFSFRACNLNRLISSSKFARPCILRGILFVIHLQFAGSSRVLHPSHDPKEQRGPL